MRKRAARLRALIISAVFCASLISPTLVVNHASALAPSDSEKALTNFNNSFIVPDGPEAEILYITVVLGATVKGEKGMRVDASFDLNHGKDVACKMIAYFYFDDADDTPLKTDDPNYRSKDGTVSAHANFTPKYENTFYNDMKFFVPYKALNLASGTYDLKYRLKLFDHEGELLFDTSEWYKFRLTMPSSFAR